MSQPFNYKLLPHQDKFQKSNARYLLGSGGVGSGKTYSIVLRTLRLIIKYPGIEILLGAQTFPLLRDTTLQEFIKLIPDSMISNYNKTTTTFHFINGSKVLFRPFDDPNKLKSLNLGACGIEEMSDVKEDIFKMLRTRMRQKGMPGCIYGATNPSSFNNFCYKNFIESPLNNSEVIYSKSVDNPHLPEEYLADLESIKITNPEYYARMVEGRWGSLEGLIYNLPISQRILRSELPQKFDRVIAGIDFGFGHPTALVVVGIISGKWYIIDEVYRRSLTSFDIINVVREKVNQYNIEKIFCDTARPEIIQDLKNAGLPAYDAIKTVFDGILYQQSLINSGLLFVCNDCRNTIREFDSYIWDKDKEQPLKINDDSMDALRYALFTDRIPGFKFIEIRADKEIAMGIQPNGIYNPFLHQKQIRKPSFNF